VARAWYGIEEDLLMARFWRFSAWPVLVGSLVVTFAACSRGGQPAVQIETVAKGPFGWMVGDWWGSFEGGCADERWAASVGGSLMGMFRYSKAGKVEFYEFQAIESGADGPTLLLRHFKPGLIAWEEKDKPMVFRLLSQAAAEAVFEYKDPAKPAKITYRKPGTDEMVVTVVERRRDGVEEVNEFHYQRMRGLNPCETP
jgi:Domain of unknown function (DUF6265)